jgi:hypothetical protein
MEVAEIVIRYQSNSSYAALVDGPAFVFELKPR